MILRNAIYLLSLVLTILWVSCDWNDHKDNNTCDDGEISAADAVWSHGEGDLQNTRRQPEIRNKGCLSLPSTAPVLQWSFDIGGPGTAAAPVIGDDGTIYIVGEYPGEPLGGGIRRSGLMAISSSGSLKWFFERPIDIEDALAAYYTRTVALGTDGTVCFSFDDSTLYSINSDGSVQWLYRSTFPFTDPAIDRNGKVYAATKDTIFCFNSDGSIRWRSPQPDILYGCTKLILGRNLILVGLFNQGILALDYSGKKKWLYSVYYGYTGHRGIVLDEDDNCYFKTGDNNLISLDKNGNYRWGIGVYGGLGISEPVIRGQNLFFGSFTWVYSLNKDIGQNPKELALFSRAIDFDSSPLIGDDGVLLVAPGPHLAAVSRDNGTLWKISLIGAERADFSGYFALTPNGEIYLATWSTDPLSTNRLYKFK